MSPRNSIFAGIACIVVGLPPLAIGTGLLSAAPGKLHAPGRILFGICAIALDGLATWGWYRWLKGPGQDVQ
jgi:hypothetical protein